MQRKGSGPPRTKLNRVQELEENWEEAQKQPKRPGGEKNRGGDLINKKKEGGKGNKRREENKTIDVLVSQLWGGGGRGDV